MILLCIFALSCSGNKVFKQPISTKKFVSRGALGRSQYISLYPNHEFAYINNDLSTIVAVGKWTYNKGKIELTQDETKIKPVPRDIFPDTLWVHVDNKVLKIKKNGKILQEDNLIFRLIE